MQKTTICGLLNNFQIFAKTRVMKKQFLILLCFVLLLSVTVSVAQPIYDLSQIDNGFLADYEDVQSANKNKIFGNFIKTQLKEKDASVGGQKAKQGEVVFKLFGFIPIKKVQVVLSSGELYYVGGVPIGISINTDGAIVISDEAGNSCLKEGDIITHINGTSVNNLEQIQEEVQKCGEEVEIEYLRRNKPLKALLKTYEDDGKLKLGLWVKDDVSGIGTLTFVNKNSQKYGALGHPIVEANSGNIVPITNGKIYPCNLIGINKGKKNAPGELKCVMLSNSKSKGSIESNDKFGIDGVLSDTSGIVDENLTAHLGGRLGVKMGKASIVSSVSGIREEYEIEIIKASYQKSADDKSIIFRVKDKRLLNLTGGIVQGMSGSPIMQDGKIVGAVTHVFLNDPCKGYGVYVDWMLNKNSNKNK